MPRRAAQFTVERVEQRRVAYVGRHCVVLVNEKSKKLTKVPWSRIVDIDFGGALGTVRFRRSPA